MTHTIIATDQEIAALRVLLHRAVLHGGMDVAEVAVMWNHKLTVALSAAPAQHRDNDDVTS